MRTKMLSLGLAMVVTVFATLPAVAAGNPVNVSLISPLALVPPTESVTGFRFNFIYGKNTSVESLDIGLVNHTTKNSNGLQWGAVNYNEGGFNGFQLGMVNYNEGTANGLQWGSVNFAGTERGVQVAFVNYAERLEGFQVGFLNIAKKGGRFPAMVIANWKK